MHAFVAQCLESHGGQTQTVAQGFPLFAIPACPAARAGIQPPHTYTERPRQDLVRSHRVVSKIGAPG